MGKRVHFLGIGGSGASAAAAIAEAQGFEVNGCDLEPQNEFTTQFTSNQLIKGHDPKHLENVDILATTPAIFSLDLNNPELLEAKKLGVPVITWQQFVGEYLTTEKFVIAVCGTHGKTTTTAMIAQILEDAKLDPTVLLGAIHPKWGANYRLARQNTSDRKYFVIEADEFNDNFLHFKPDITVVTTIEMDHPEYFKDFESYKESFKQFLLSKKGTGSLQAKGNIVANLSDSGVADVLKAVMKETSTPAVDYSKNQLDIDLKIPGEYNKQNAMAAMQVGLMLGIAPEIIRKSLENYTGVGRRFELIGKYNGAQVYSDFGHHPTEIKVTIEAVRQKFPDSRILLIYQPHMFSRTKFLFEEFIKVFKNIPVDKTYIMDIYPSREVDTGSITSKQLVDAVGKNNVVYIGSTEQVLEKLKPEITTGDIVFFMSAVDTDYLAKKLTQSLN